MLFPSISSDRLPIDRHDMIANLPKVGGVNDGYSINDEPIYNFSF